VTEPQPVMDQAEQDQLTRQVGRALLAVAGAGWQQVRAEYRSVGKHIEVDVFVTGPDGAVNPVRPPVDVVEGLGKLRQGMYRPGRGTWLSARYVLDPPSSFSAEFEPDVEPRWRRLPPPIGFADELRFFPRADEHIPEWLRQRAGLRPAGDPTPPGGSPGPAGAGPAGGPGQGRPEAPGGPGQPGGFDSGARPPAAGDPSQGGPGRFNMPGGGQPGSGAGQPEPPFSPPGGAPPGFAPPPHQGGPQQQPGEWMPFQHGQGWAPGRPAW